MCNVISVTRLIAASVLLKPNVLVTTQVRPLGLAHFPLQPR